jgi:dTMP kinase
VRPDWHGSIDTPATPWLSRLAGRFIVFEGPDGSGKSTQFRRLALLCERAGLTVCQVREPGGTDVGEKIREVLLDRAHTEMSLRCEMMLYMASRAELLERRIAPALARGELVLADRYVASTLAYQGTAGGLPAADIEAVAHVATRGMAPDLYLVFDIDEIAAEKRLSPLLDRMEAKGREFHREVRRGYLEQAGRDPARYALVDASKGPDEVWEQVVHVLEARSAAFAPRAGAKSGGDRR